METLSHNDFLALNRAIGELYTARDVESFYRSAFSTIQSLIPGELCSFTDAIPHPTRFLRGMRASSQEHCNAFSKHLPALNAHLHEHPLIPHFFSDHVFKTADYAPRRRFKATAVYNEYYRHLDIESQMGFSIPISQEKVSIVGLSRKTPDFSERDRLLLTLLKPHMITALRNAIEFGRMKHERDLLQRGAEAERQGAVLVQSDGTILCISPFATELFARYFEAVCTEGDTLPKSLLKWFAAETNPASPSLNRSGSKGFPQRVEREPLTLAKEDRSVKITLLNDFTTGDYVLILNETDTSLLLQNLQGYGLSCREAEVLLWLSKGKTNVEIAVILGMSRRTVEKHMEHIFAKLGVETRAAAAAIMMD